MIKKKTTKKKVVKRGRKTLYKKTYCEQAYKLCLLGFTDKKLADFFGVEEKTINNWKRNHNEFLQSVTRGKDIADAEVAESFHKKAVGYEYEEKHYGEDGNLFKKIVKEVTPDAGACLNWLKNRQKDTWRDKQEIESNNTHVIDGNHRDMTNDELFAILKE